MTQIDVLKMAIKAGLATETSDGRHQIWYPDNLCHFANLVAAKAVAKESKEAWKAVNALIVLGDIGGNGTDPKSQRNGVILATNVLMERIDRGQA